MSGNFSLNGVLMDIAGAAISKAGSTRKEIPRCSQKPDAVTATVLAGFLLVFVATACCSSPVLANDLLRTTSGAAALGSGGVSLLATDPLAAMSNNPALLGGQDRSIQIGGQAVLVDAKFRSSRSELVKAKPGPGLIPEAALVLPLQDSRVTIGALVMLRSALRAEFDFVDPPGTLNVSYGRQRHLSEYVVLETSAGIGFKISDQLSLGASLGLLYNRNTLQAPYIFQTHPVLTGLKVLVDLEADDLAASGKVGVRYRFTDEVNFSLSYSAQTDFESRGKLSGDLSRLGLGIQSDFNYRALVKTALPATLSTALAWSVTDSLTAGLQLDWIHWSAAFDRLPLVLTRGTNEELNDFLSSDSIDDTAPLGWKDQLGIQLGIRYQIRAATTLRAGVGIDEVPVPQATFTPMTGAILDRSLSLGFSTSGFSGYQLDIGYRYSKGSEFGVRESLLAGGEYTNSRLDLALHTLFASFRF